MCYTQRQIQGGVSALRESDDTTFLKPNRQSRNLNIYGNIKLGQTLNSYVYLFFQILDLLNYSINMYYII